jgi:hypothetical protein
MNCPIHVHTKMLEQSEAVNKHHQCSNMPEKTYRLVFRCNVWADYAKTRRCSQVSVLYLPEKSKLCIDCGCILSTEQRAASRKRCCAHERIYRKKVR